MHAHQVHLDAKKWKWCTYTYLILCIAILVSSAVATSAVPAAAAAVAMSLLGPKATRRLTPDAGQAVAELQKILEDFMKSRGTRDLYELLKEPCI